ncbi:MAG: inositol monophosphatase family protein [Spirochaetaceae bacterium]|nr:MAG: inositol monophosphatase family protein [Spirochaetaceae bacterium]
MNGTSQAELAGYAEAAVEIAREAGRLTTQYYRSAITVERKDDDSPVTVADREAEALIRRRLRKRFPDHGVLGEEAGLDGPDSAWRWIIDPIDGTQSFIHGIPLYAQLIALSWNETPLLGVIHNPVLDETVWAWQDGGCFYNGKPTRVRDNPALHQAWVHTCDPADLARRQPQFTSRLLHAIGSMRTWSDAHGYLLVATGRADACLDPVMAAWDIAPMYPIIEEAGGRASDFKGVRSPLGNNLIAATPRIHQQLLDLLD